MLILNMNGKLYMKIRKIKFNESMEGYVRFTVIK